jgi:Zn-dependent protease/CBS domain-containing protein
MFGKSLTLVKLFGFEVKINASWLLLGLLIVWSLARGLFPSLHPGLSLTDYWLMGVAGAIGLLVSIVFHELWHSLIARRFGLPMKGITLFIFGGVAEMSDEPPSAKAEFLMAVAGPLSSIVLGGAFLGIGFLGHGGHWPVPVVMVTDYLGFLNLILAAFNLIPAFPLDGGRVLRSILWGWKSDINWATRVASGVGTGFAYVLMGLGGLEFLMGSFIGGVWMFLIGLFLRGASQMSYRQLLVRNALQGEKVRDFMKADPVTVPPGISVQELVDHYVLRHHFKMYPVVEDGRLVGCVTLSQIKDVPRAEWGTRRVSDMNIACGPDRTVSPDDEAMKALSLMSRLNASRLMVIEGGELRGVITLKDMMGLLALKADLKGRA